MRTSPHESYISTSHSSSTTCTERLSMPSTPRICCLCAGGLRFLLEGVCVDKRITKGPNVKGEIREKLEGKINGLKLGFGSATPQSTPDGTRGPRPHVECRRPALRIGESADRILYRVSLFRALR